MLITAQDSYVTTRILRLRVTASQHNTIRRSCRGISRFRSYFCNYLSKLRDFPKTKFEVLFGFFYTFEMQHCNINIYRYITNVLAHDASDMMSV